MKWTLIAAILCAAAMAMASACRAQTRPASDSAARFTIDTAQPGTPISPLIYGVNPGSPGGTPNPGLHQPPYDRMNATFVRLGGNRWSAYNFGNNASNAGSDWKYESDTYLGGGSTPGGAVLPVLRSARSDGIGVLLTVPMVGYVAADTAGEMDRSIPPQRSPHFVPEYPTRAQDPAPAANHVYQDQFVRLVRSRMDGAPPPVVAFDLDNEPSLWSSTHPEVHPAALTYAELLDRSIAYATMIKSVYPRALVYGPASYGWEGYQTLQNAADAAPNGPFLDYYLKRMNAASTRAGKRLLDVLDLHWYTEATGPGQDGKSGRAISSDTATGVAAARMDAPRSLWDPTYVETSWITDPRTGPLGTGGKAIDLIHRLQGKIAANNPGTRLSFSEYSFGGGGDISGGIAEADALGIFGKFGVFSANQWPTAADERFLIAAFKMFRNYDARNATFGDTELPTTNSDAAHTSIYASADSHYAGRLILVLINKRPAATDATATLAGPARYSSGTAYQLTAAAAEPVRLADVPVVGNVLDFIMPKESVTTIRLDADR